LYRTVKELSSLLVRGAGVCVTVRTLQTTEA